MEFALQEEAYGYLAKGGVRPMTVRIGGHEAEVSILVPSYKAKVFSHYADIVGGDPAGFLNRSQLPLPFAHFGVQCVFKRPAELMVLDGQMQVVSGLKRLMAAHGPVIIKNAYLLAWQRKETHRNRFPHLNFHRDRSPSQPTRFSVYTRDPFDEIQRQPRTSSTLFTANAVGYLQAIREGLNEDREPGCAPSYNLFAKANMAELLGGLIVEHRWDEPEGVGEISMLDNATMLHASYYRRAHEKGYRIGVRYVA